MANMAMAQAVLNHAHDYYDAGSWYVIAECWDTLAILEELDQQEERTAKPFALDVEAISHFSGIVHRSPKDVWARH
jgi:hypothetical protein